MMMVIGNLGLVSVFVTLVVSLVHTDGEVSAFPGTYGMDTLDNSPGHLNGGLMKQHEDHPRTEGNSSTAKSLNWSDVTRWASHGNPPPPRRVEKTEAQWRELLTDEQFGITRLQGTERAHSSEMCRLFEPGRYECLCCGTLLFDAASKFDSHSGWPSFTQPVAPGVIAYHQDNGHSMNRIETTCNVCDAHLGHVFPDGPEPSGLRFCINAVSLKKIVAVSTN